MPIRHRPCEEDYAWDHITCTCKCDKGYGINEYLRGCLCMESLADESEDRPEITSVNPYVKENHWLINVVVLAACLLLLIVIVFQYYMKQIKNFILFVILV